MGLFSKIKNSITGGWADVSLMVNDAQRGSSASVTVNVSVKSESINVDEVYLILRCMELVEIPDYRVHDRNDPGSSDRVHIDESEELYEQRISIAPAQTMEANQQYSFDTEIDIPAHLPPSYTGKYSKIDWSVLAGLDMKGNDPDSGWQIFPVG